MIHPVWRLSEPGDDNLGLACDENGLVLGRTRLIERRNGSFVVRDEGEIESLLGHAYRRALPLQRLMAGLANVAKALNANDLCLHILRRSICEFPTCPIEARETTWKPRISSSNRAIGIPRFTRGRLAAPPTNHPRRKRPRTSRRIKLPMRR